MHKVVSLMSGTSLDGVDIACCEFDFNSKWNFRLLNAETIAYDQNWLNRLANASNLSGLDLTELNVRYGEFLGEVVSDFMKRNNIRADFVSSHGHTIFHQPRKGFTLQIGSGPAIASKCGLPVVCDFRTTDVSFGGQGAPLVPIGDRLLFSEYDSCLNLGGIANISFESKGERLAFDICACNIVLNHYASKRNMPYDKDGLLASKGNVNDRLLNELNTLPYHSGSFPKSLGREDIEREVFPLLENSGLSVEDILATFSECIAVQIGNNIPANVKHMLISGGGAFNSWLVNRIRSKSKCEVIIPPAETINFKEAIVFGFLGVLRMEKKVNSLRSVTGAVRDSCGGAIYQF